jgi:hypothetical protein
VVEVKAQGVGALVRIQAEGRVAIESLAQVQPYLIGTVTPLVDDAVPAAGEEAVLKAADALVDVLRVGATGCGPSRGVGAWGVVERARQSSMG